MVNWPRPFQPVGIWPRTCWAGLLACAVALVAGCTAAPPPEIPGAAALRGFLIDIPLPPYEMRGAITAAIHGRTESGEVYLRSGPGDAHLFQLRAH